MTLPILKILVIEDEPALLHQITENMSTCIHNFERDDVVIQILEAPTVSSALAQIEKDGEIQAIVLSWAVDGRREETEEGKQEVIHDNVTIINALKADDRLMKLANFSNV